MIVGPVLAVLVAVAHEDRASRVPNVEVANQDASEVVASLRVELLEKFAEVAISTQRSRPSRR
jgi:hypothetical protein